MLSKNHPLILFIDRFGFSVYQDVLTNIPKFNFTPDLVSNMDVVNKDQFKTLIATFIQINKMVPGSLAVILSDDIIYIKDLAKPTLDDKEHQDEMQTFLEDIPFEDVLAKTIRIGEASRVVAANKDLVMTIVEVFKSKGFIIETITPGFMYGQSANFATGLTLSNIQIIFGNAEILKTGNLLTDQEKLASPQGLGSELKPPSTDKTKKPQSMRQFMLIGVFVTLLVILAVVYLNMGVSQTVPEKPKAKGTAANTLTVPTAVPTLAQVIVSPIPVDLKTVKIKITQNTQTDGKAVNLKNSLLNMGFQDVLVEISEASAPLNSSVVFSQGISADLRNNIIVEIKKILPDISILESQESGLTVNIIIGKS